MSRPARILITGGAGFIGGHLARRLIAQGTEVVVLDDLSSGSRDAVQPEALFHHGSVCDPAAVVAAVEGCSGIVHLAAMVSVPECVADWTGGHRVNIGGTITVMQAARAAGNLPVVYASSAAIYGDQQRALCHEALLPAPLSPYGADKLSCEHHARAFWTIHGLPSAGLRFFNVFGPGQSIRSPYAGVVARFCDNARTGTPHTLFGDGRQTRDFVHVTDVVEIIRRALDRLAAEPDALVSNVCTNRAISLLDLVATLDDIVPGSAAGMTFMDARAGDIHDSRGCDRRMRALFGDLPGTTLRDGLAEILSPDPRPMPAEMRLDSPRSPGS